MTILLQHFYFTTKMTSPITRLIYTQTFKVSNTIKHIKKEQSFSLLLFWVNLKFFFQIIILFLLFFLKVKKFFPKNVKIFFKIKNKHYTFPQYILQG